MSSHGLDFAAARRTLELLRHPLDFAVLATLATGPRRFRELSRELDVGHATLSRTLRRMTANGLFTRELTAEARPTYASYALSARGLSLLIPVQALAEWDLDEGGRRPRAAGNH